MAPLLIALNGFKGSGKNTAGNFIKEWGEARGLVVEQRAFADLLKLSAARSLGLATATNINDAVVLMDSLKETGEIDVMIPGQSLIKTITGREFLKWYGTEAHRDVFWKDFWVDQILPLPATNMGDWTLNFRQRGDVFADIAIVTDCRFVNEAQRVHDLGGFVWNIHRPEYEADEHISEQPLPLELIHQTLINASSLEAFEVEVKSRMTMEHHMRFVPKPDSFE